MIDKPRQIDPLELTIQPFEGFFVCTHYPCKMSFPFEGTEAEAVENCVGTGDDPLAALCDYAVNFPKTENKDFFVTVWTGDQGDSGEDLSFDITFDKGTLTIVVMGSNGPLPLQAENCVRSEDAA